MAKISAIFVTPLRSVRNMAVARIGRFKFGEGAGGDCVGRSKKNYRKESSFFLLLPTQAPPAPFPR